MNYNKEIQAILRAFAGALHTGKPSAYANMIVLPVMEPAYDLDYISSDEGFERGCLTIKEVSESGSVPRLSAVNQCGQHVLLAEGEEIKGAKQNRTLNTSILLPADKETVIPVSCTERGRWSYRKKDFSPTDSWVPAELRRKKIFHVTKNLIGKDSYRSNQSAVWHTIDNYSERLGTRSRTSALRDVLGSAGKRIERMTEAFPLGKGQTGVVVFINGRLTGADIITNPRVFARLYPKILKSYVVDAVLKGGDKSGGLLDLHTEVRYRAGEARKKFSVMLELALTGRLFVAKSPGLGRDVRMESTQVSGFALEVDGRVVHMNLFRNDNDEETERHGRDEAQYRRDWESFDAETRRAERERLKKRWERLRGEKTEEERKREDELWKLLDELNKKNRGEDRQEDGGCGQDNGNGPEEE
ncbi:MAG: hypothetical protein GXO24_03350 [Chlorobi bacterium]|nr:hypothetical protein [Chlorobiota bacterium]